TSVFRLDLEWPSQDLRPSCDSRSRYPAPPPKLQSRISLGRHRLPFLDQRGRLRSSPTPSFGSDFQNRFLVIPGSTTSRLAVNPVLAFRPSFRQVPQADTKRKIQMRDRSRGSPLRPNHLVSMVSDHSSCSECSSPWKDNRD